MTTNEKEILLEEVPEEKTEAEPQEHETHEENHKNSTETSPMKFVERKNVSQLTEEERNIIVANARAGVEQPNFDVTFFKNGNFRIVKKKVQSPTVAQRVIKQASPTSPTSNSPAFYTDNQLLFEHIIELTSKVEKLTAKHKKLKHKYNDLQHDLYIDDNSNDEEERETQITEPEVEPPQIIPQRVNWRNQIRFL